MKHGSCYTCHHNDLEGHSNFSSAIYNFYSVLGTSLLWRSTVAFTYLKVKSAKCLCLLLVVLVLVLRIWFCIHHCHMETDGQWFLKVREWRRAVRLWHHSRICYLVISILRYKGYSQTFCSSAIPLLDQPFMRTAFSRRAFHFSAPSVWNSLVQTVFISDSLSV